MFAHVTYRDLESAAAWLRTRPGFVETFRYGEPVAGIQMRRGDAVIMLNLPTATRKPPIDAGAATQSLTIVVDDVDRLYEAISGTGDRIVEALNETMYGERQFVVADPEGHHWLIAQHVKDIAPEEWGASVPKLG